MEFKLFLASIAMLSISTVNAEICDVPIDNYCTTPQSFSPYIVECINGFKQPNKPIPVHQKGVATAYTRTTGSCALESIVWRIKVGTSVLTVEGCNTVTGIYKQGTPKVAIADDSKILLCPIN